LVIAGCKKIFWRLQDPTKLILIHFLRESLPSVQFYTPPRFSTILHIQF